MNCPFCHKLTTLLEEKQNGVMVYRCFNHPVPTGLYYFTHTKTLQITLVAKYNNNHYAVKLCTAWSPARIEKWGSFRALSDGYWMMNEDDIIEESEIIRLDESPDFTPENVNDKLAVILLYM